MSSVTAILQLLQPWHLMTGASALGIVAGLPLVWRQLEFQRWYRWLLIGTWLALGAVTAILLAIVAPLILLAGLVGAMFVSIVVMAQEREKLRLDQEGLAFMNTALARMAGGQAAWMEVIEELAVAQGFPRIRENLQQILSHQRANSTSLSVAMREATDAVPARAFWRQLAHFTAQCENISVDAQFKGLRVLISIRETLTDAQATVKREMMQMRLAQAVLCLILPGLNAYYYFVAPEVFVSFIEHPAGKVILFFEALCLLAVFVTLNRLQKIEVPEW